MNNEAVAHLAEQSLLIPVIGNKLSVQKHKNKEKRAENGLFQNKGFTQNQNCLDSYTNKMIYSEIFLKKIIDANLIFKFKLARWPP